MNRKKQTDELLLTIETSDKRTLDTIDAAYLMARRAVDRAARQLAQARAKWHDDSENDPIGYAEHHAPADEQFDDECRAAVVLALFRRCDRVRQER